MATVTIQEAAQHLGVSQDTVRRRIRKEELQARQTPTPQGFRWVVELEDLEEDAPAAPTPTHRPDIGGAQVEDGQDLRELVDALRSQLQSQGGVGGPEAGGPGAARPPPAKGAPRGGRTPVVAVLAWPPGLMSLVWVYV